METMDKRALDQPLITRDGLEKVHVNLQPPEKKELPSPPSHGTTQDREDWIEMDLIMTEAKTILPRVYKILLRQDLWNPECKAQANKIAKLHSEIEVLDLYPSTIRKQYMDLLQAIDWFSTLCTEAIPEKGHDTEPAGIVRVKLALLATKIRDKLMVMDNIGD